MTSSVLATHCALFCDHNVDVLSQQFNPAFIEHSSYVANGLDGLRTLVKECPDIHYECLSALRSGEWALLCGTFTGLDAQPLTGFDLYQLDTQERPVAHWDVLSEAAFDTRPPQHPLSPPAAPDSLSFVHRTTQQRMTATTDQRHLRCDILHRIIAQGDLVFTLSEGHAGKQRYAIAELWQTDGRAVMGRWPTAAPIPSDAEAVHSHGLF